MFNNDTTRLMIPEQLEILTQINIQKYYFNKVAYHEHTYAPLRVFYKLLQK